MSSLLDQLYPSFAGAGTMDKVAEAATEELDLNTISAADFIALMEAREADEAAPPAGEQDQELDLSNMTARELAELIDASEQEKVAAADDAILRSMIADGSFQSADMAGRIMARAQMDELQKLAAAQAPVDELPDFISIDDISAQDMVALLESGEYELEKDAGAWGDAAKATGSGIKAGAEKVWSAAKRGGDLLTGSSARKTLREEAGEGMGDRIKHWGKSVVGAKGSTEAGRSEVRKSLGAQAAVAGGVGGIVGLVRHGKKKKAMREGN
jgi:hypothetical protein